MHHPDPVTSACEFGLRINYVTKRAVLASFVSLFSCRYPYADGVQFGTHVLNTPLK